MSNSFFDNISLKLFNTQLQICYCADTNINNIVKEYKESNINLENLNLYLKKNVWNRFYSITIALLDLYSGKSYNYTIPAEILHEINDNCRLVVSYQCECYSLFPNFTWFNLWEYFINSYEKNA